ncbi:hypothetical protein QCD71_12220 [Sphingomonas sp. PsM26]|nr:hypothetical protein [Sphingomonas sp. PsM26]
MNAPFIPDARFSGIADLARKWSRAIEKGKGIRIEAGDIDLLTAIGVNDLIQTAAAESLKDKAKCRDVQRRREFINGVPSGSTGTERRTDPSAAPSLRSSGMTQSEDASDLLQHALTMSRPPARR